MNKKKKNVIFYNIDVISLKGHTFHISSCKFYYSDGRFAFSYKHIVTQ